MLSVVEDCVANPVTCLITHPINILEDPKSPVAGKGSARSKCISWYHSLSIFASLILFSLCFREKDENFIYTLWKLFFIPFWQSDQLLDRLTENVFCFLFLFLFCEALNIPYHELSPCLSSLNNKKASIIYLFIYFFIYRQLTCLLWPYFLPFFFQSFSSADGSCLPNFSITVGALLQTHLFTFKASQLVPFRWSRRHKEETSPSH